MKKYIKRIVGILGASALITLSVPTNTVFAASANLYVKGDSYQVGDDFSIDKNSASDVLAFGKKSIGKLSISGDIASQENYKGTNAFNVNDSVEIKYFYDGSFNVDKEEGWTVISADSKKIDSIELKKNIDKGVIIVQKSSDGKNWEMASEPFYDSFKKSNYDNSVIYSVDYEDAKKGTYFRVLVGYSMERKTGSQGGWKVPIFDKQVFEEDIIDSRNFCEKYTFFVGTAKNNVIVRDIMSKKALDSGEKITSGFYIDKQNSDDIVTVKLNNGNSKTSSQFDSFTDVGKYTVEVQPKLGKTYFYNLQVNAGLSRTSLSPMVYESKKGNGFVEETKISGQSSAGISSLTTLKIAQNAGYTTTKSKYNGFDAYGVNGDSAHIFIRLNYSDDLLGGNWKVFADKYGKKEKDLVYGVQTGTVGKGAVIVQTSVTGKSDDWINVEKGRYAEGLYTSDFGSNYASKEDVLLYTPKGTDIQNGLYIRVIYAYQVNNSEEKEYVDCIEKYEFYLCSSNLGAIRFNNLSLEKDSFEKQYGDADSNTLAIYKSAETLPSDACTVSGFKIDKSKNPTTEIKVERDGKEVSVPTDFRFTETGKYSIHLTSDVGTSQDVTLFVDRESDEESLKRYFGDGFLKGVRVYEEDNYPVYEGGVTSYNLEKVSECFLPVSGIITNTSTGQETVINPSRQARSGKITTPGNYTAVFRTGLSNEISVGDVRTFTFNFRIIAEGTAPGPVINKENLYENYVHMNVTDSYPLYYAVSYQSATGGRNITLAFKDKKDAISYAYNYETGAVEKLSDGSFRYSGSLLYKNDSLKFESDAGWDIADAMNAFAERAVFEGYFDLSDDATYMTLSDDILENTKNLRTLELDRSVVVYSDSPENQKALLTDLDCLPIISEKPYVYVVPGKTKQAALRSGTNDFEFVKDKYGCDSNSVTITDVDGKLYDIKYKVGVGRQLKEAGCPSGIVTITEKTVDGYVNEYEAIYISPEDNTSLLSISYFDGGREVEKQINQDNADESLVVDAFSIESFVDEFDPYSIISIKKDENAPIVYAGDQMVTGAWSEPGKYAIHIVNRLGYGYTVNIEVRNSDYSVVSFEGEGTDEIKDIITTFGAENITLPVLERDGFEFEGFIDQNGKKYRGKIDTIKIKGTLLLTVQWKPIVVDVVLADIDGNIISREHANYGTIYELPDQTPSDGCEFSGWLYDGNVYEKTIEVKSKEDMVLTPLMTNVDTGEVSTSDMDVVTKNAEESKNNVGTIIFWVIFLVVIIGVFLFGVKNIRAIIEKVGRKVGKKDE